ncbi:MAG: acetoacetate decarboxylase family protein [Nostoc sp.]|uniref:acetoacetate decarboxylase family protein n=1 Tax=Nostoc sp. TaxID=1180 RepID=UPI002FF8926C
MTYPSTPWILQGYAYQTLQLVDTKSIRTLVPTEMEIYNILPGKTLGGVYLACYGSGSVLEYSELFVAAALVRYAGRLGLFCSHVYVDNADAAAAGREIWGLPTQMADFSWSKTKHVCCRVRQQQRLLCTLEVDWQLLLWQQSLALPSFSANESNLFLFEGEAECRLGLVSARLAVPAQSPLTNLGNSQPWLTICAQSLHLVAYEPKIFVL